MDMTFDNVARRFAQDVSRRGAVRAIVSALGSLAFMVCGITEPTAAKCASGQKDCGDFCCSSTTACCFTARVCCSTASPHYCANTKLCYRDAGGASAACGQSYEVCASPL